MTYDDECERVSRLLTELLESDLDESVNRRLAEHVERCPHCHEIADVEDHIRQVLRRVCPERAPATLRQRVLKITVQRTTYYG
ncbi:MAG: zf-HC2 domain-containing protein [Bowdeniella nasicola]|nr:zf-HC2 domain-containing protein [Bowdeniella nasicola]